MNETKAPNPRTDLPAALRGRRQLAGDEAFHFGCHQRLECFKRCCRDVNIPLTPVDVLRLARRLDMDTGVFLARHAVSPFTKELNLPVHFLRMREDDPEKRCPFLDLDGAEGCGVYEDRPWSCRMYPVGLAVPPARAGETPEPLFFLFEDRFCDGGTVPKEWTVAAWRRDQGIEEREELEAGYRAIVSHAWFIGGRKLGPRRMEMFHTAFFDLDKFRRFLFDSTFLERIELEDGLVEALRTDDEALLGFAPRWLRFALFSEPTLAVRLEAQATADAKQQQKRDAAEAAGEA